VTDRAGQTLGAATRRAGQRRRHQSRRIDQPPLSWFGIFSPPFEFGGARTLATRTRGAQRARAAGYANLLVVDRNEVSKPFWRREQVPR